MSELSKVAGNDIEINYISIYPQGMARKGNFEKAVFILISSHTWNPLIIYVIHKL